MSIKKNIWDIILNKLQTSDVYYWISKLAFVRVESDTLVLSTRSSFIKDKILANYSDDILQAVHTISPTIKTLNIQLLSSNLIQTTVKHQSLNTLGKYTIVNKKLTFSNYIPDASNQLAYTISQQISTNVDLEYNPVVLCGPVGIGKTHLMHAIANARQRSFPTQNIIYLPAEGFTYLFLNYLQSKKIPEFKELFKSIDMLLIDDLQFIKNKIATQNEFLAIFNEFLLSNRQIVIASSSSISNLQFDSKLSSRLAGGISANIQPTTYQLRLNILKLKAKQSGVHISRDILEYMANNIVLNVRELDGALRKLIVQAHINHQPISIDLIKNTLGDILTESKLITVADINQAICNYFNVSINDLLSNKRAKEILIPRQMAMHLIKKLTNKSYPEISLIFNKKHHSTVIHAVKKVITTQDLYDLSELVKNEINS